MALACGLHLTILYLCLIILGAFQGLHGFLEVSEVVWEFRSKTPLNHWPSCQLLSPADYVLAYYSGYTYMLTGTLGVCIYFMAFGWTSHSRPTYMSAGTLGVWIYFMGVSWTTCSRCRYMSAGTFRACMIFPARWLHHLYVKMLFSALHYSTWSQEGFQTLASAHALCLTTLYSCPSISDAFQGLQGFMEVLEVVWEFGSKSRTGHSPERGQHRGQV